jgi:hypothetical protein
LERTGSERRKEGSSHPDIAMIRLTKTINAWGTPGFEDTLKGEVEQLDADQLPLQQALSTSSHVTDSQRTVTIIRASDDEDLIHIKAGIFYSGIIAGCSCADDPTPIDEQNEYCVVQIEINKQTAEATITLLDE